MIHVFNNYSTTTTCIIEGQTYTHGWGPWPPYFLIYIIYKINIKKIFSFESLNIEIMLPLFLFGLKCNFDLPIFKNMQLWSLYFKIEIFNPPIF